MPHEPNMDRFHEGPSLRGYDDETAHLRELEAEDRQREKRKDLESFHERESLGFAFKEQWDKAKKNNGQP